MESEVNQQNHTNSNRWPWECDGKTTPRAFGGFGKAIGRPRIILGLSSRIVSSTAWLEPFDKVFRAFPRFYSKFWVGTPIPHCSTCFTYSPPNVKSNCHYNADFPTLIPKLIPIIRSKTPAHHNTHFTFITSQTFTLPQTYLYQKDERPLPVNLQTRRIFLP
jgi:hypothetical protein